MVTNIILYILGFIVVLISIICLWIYFSNSNIAKSKTLESKDNSSIFTPLQTTTYESLLQTPQWKEKRSVILIRDHNQCQYCGNRYDLQIHHKYYSKYPNGQKVNPWNYPEDALITLCDSCHKKVHGRKKIKFYYRKYDN